MSDVTTIEADVPERYADAVQARLQKADEDGSPGLDPGSLSELLDGLKPPEYHLKEL